MRAKIRTHQLLLFFIHSPIVEVLLSCW